MPMVYLNYPVPTKLADEWKGACDKIGISYQDAIAGLMQLSLVLPSQVSHLIANIALGRIPMSIAGPVLDRMRNEIAQLFPEDPAQEPPQSDENDKPKSGNQRNKDKRG